MKLNELEYKNRLISRLLSIFALLIPSFAFATDHTVNAEARAFKPDIIYIQAGDTVKFINMTSHNSVSYLHPEGAGWGERGKGLGKNLQIKLEQEGVYGYVCDPHIGFGMVGVVVVGGVSTEDIAAVKQQAKDTLEGPYKRIIGKINKLKPTK